MYTRAEYIQASYELESELLHLFKREDALTVFDIGACEGEDSIRLSRLFPHSTIYTFEPLPKNQERIKTNFQEYRATNAKLFPFALSNQNGEAVFHVSSGAPQGKQNDENWDFGNKSSSLLPPDEENKKMYPWLDFKEEIRVTTKTLQSFCQEEGIAQIDYIHMDVQGAEKLVLEGAGNLLQKTKAIFLEVESVSLYKGQALKDDIETFLTGKGFYKALDKSGNITGDQLYLNDRYFNKNQLYPPQSFWKKITNIWK